MKEDFVIIRGNPSMGKTRTNISDDDLTQEYFAAIGKSFRGEIWDNCKRFRLVGGAYASMPREQDGHFDIRTARHLEGPLRALLDPNVRMVFIIGATQVLKSVVGDIWTVFVIEHLRRNLLILFETDDKAQMFCDARLMETIRAHPQIKSMIDAIDRHAATKTRLTFPDFKVEIGGMNESNLSSLTWPLIWISEAWQHKSDGMLKKGIKRADRFPNDCKILIESQAGDAEEDLHREARAAHQVHLTWACPACGGRQTWECENELGTERPEDFQSRQTLSHMVLISYEPKSGSYAGMKFADGDEISERARTAQWECYHCGHRIADTNSARQELMDTYEQDYRITRPDGTKFSPKSVCFILPFECAIGNSFEKSTASYLTAKRAADAGNRTPLADWYKSERAIFYSPKLTQTSVSIVTGTYDPTVMIPNEVARCMAVDCQQGDIVGKTGRFWYVARAMDKDKNLFQLARGYANSWDEWIAVQKRLKIPNDSVVIDGGKYLHEILDAAAAKFEIANRFCVVNGRMSKAAIPARIVWTVLVGNGTKSSFPHDGKINRSFSKFTKYYRSVETSKGKWSQIEILLAYWSNLSVKDHLNALMTSEGGKRFISLSREQLPADVQDKERGDLTYARQMAGEYRGRDGGRDKWLETVPNNPNVHYKDCECMCLVRLDMGGKLGLPVADEEKIAA